MSAAYYSLFHDLTGQAATHLIGSAPEATRNAIRRTWSHGEVAEVAAMIVTRARVLSHNPSAPMSTNDAKWGPLVDIAASDSALVDSLRLFNELQVQRHQADYDHEASFPKLSLLLACQDATVARQELSSASAAARESLFALLTVRRPDFKGR